MQRHRFLVQQQLSLLIVAGILSIATTQEDPKIAAILKLVFTTPPPNTGTVVRADLVDPTQPQINFTSISGKAQCNCVPYHKCDPDTNMVIEDGAFDGFGLIDLRAKKDDPVCEHHLDVCCDDNKTHDKSLTPVPQDQRENRPKGCGIRNVGGIDFNITNTNDNASGFAEFPWTVALLYSSNNSYFCAGSLIHQQVVLTAAHCVIGRDISSFLVRAGEWDSQTTKERLPFEERTVERVDIHEQFNKRNVANDFALIVLTAPVTLGDHINVVCLPGQNADPVARTNCYSTGWGKDKFGAQGRYSTIMNRVLLPVVDFGECQARLRATRLGPTFALDRSFLCAGGEAGIDTCEGDGGAPLVCPIGMASQERYHQSGIVAWGIGCKDSIPAAYANVATARSWIDQKMQKNGFSTTTYSAF